MRLVEKLTRATRHFRDCCALSTTRTAGKKKRLFWRKVSLFGLKTKASYLTDTKFVIKFKTEGDSIFWELLMFMNLLNHRDSAMDES